MSLFLSTYNALLSTGTNADYSERFNERIRLTNFALAVTGGVLGVFFLIISLIFFPEIAHIPFLAVLSVGPLLLLNRFGFVGLTRFVVGVGPTLYICLMNAYLTNQGDAPLLGLSMLALGLSILPFILIRYREKWFLTIAVFINALLVAGFDGYRGLFLTQQDYQVALLMNGFLGDLLVVMGLAGALATTITLLSLSTRSEEQAESLVERAQKRSEELEASQSSLTENMKMIEEARVQEDVRRWVSDGVAEVNAILNQHNDQTLFDDIAQFLSKYTKVSQLAIFLADQDTAQEEYEGLDLVAQISFGRKKFSSKTIAPGIGLTAMAFERKEIVELHGVPHDFAEVVEDGMYVKHPDRLFIIPLMNNTRAEGVIEVLNVGEFPMGFESLMQQVSESLGASVARRFVTQQTQVLLEQAQEQTVAMQEQEEEMRQNAEEMMASQEEMYRKEQEYLDAIEKLEMEKASLMALQNS